MSFSRSFARLSILKYLLLYTFIIASFLFVGCSSNPTSDDKPTTYSINVALSPSDSGTISPGIENIVEEGDEIELRANPNNGYVFSGWTGDIESSSNPLSITANKDVELTANFELRSYELSINIEGEGTVNEQVIQQKTADYEHGTLVELTANPAEGYKFVEWQGDLTESDNPAQITIDEPKNVTAVFEEKAYELTVNTDGEGAVSEEIVQQKAKDYSHGTVVKLTANPTQGWKFIEWTGDLSGSDNPSTITISEPLSITAIFSEVTPVIVDDIPSIDNGVASFMRQYGVKGVSVAVTKNGRLVYAKGYGDANSATGTPVDTTSLFRIASLSKFITSAGIMKLIEEGKLSMDKKVFGPGAIFEDEYGTSNFPQYVQDISVRHLLHHELGGWSNSGSIDPAFAKPDYNAEELIDWVMYSRRLGDEPGTKYNYSNIGYMILGEIIEKISGKNYEDYIRENILLPSGVLNMQISHDTPSGRQENEVQYYGSSGPVRYDTDGKIRRLGSAGGWIASAIDLTRVLTHIDGFDTVPDILDRETIVLMARTSPISDYASGWRMSGSNNWWHSGSLTGTSTWILRTPDGYTWTILTNTSSSGITTGLNDLIWPAVRDGSTNWTDGDLF